MMQEKLQQQPRLPYLTAQEWKCKRCNQQVMLDDWDRPSCGCDWRNSTVTYETEDGVLELAHAAAPWEPMKGSRCELIFPRR